LPRDGLDGLDNSIASDAYYYWSDQWTSDLV